MSLRFSKCSICTAGFKLGDVATLPCGHTFHWPCINRWLNSSKTCPICRKKSTEREVTRLFFDESESGLSQAITESPSDNGEVCEELTMQLHAEKMDKKRLQADVQELQEETKTLHSKYKQEKKKADMLSIKDDRIRHLEGMLRDQDYLQRRLSESEARVKASQFFNFLVKRDGYEDTKAIDNFVKHGDPDQAKFMELLQKQLSNAAKKTKEINKMHESEISSLRGTIAVQEKKLKEYKELVVSLSETNSRLESARGRDVSPFRDLTNVGVYSPYVRRADKSLGFSFMEDGLDQSGLLKSARKTVQEIVDVDSDEEDVPAKSSIFGRQRPAPYPTKGKVAKKTTAQRPTPTFGKQTELFSDALKILTNADAKKSISPPMFRQKTFPF